MRAVVADAAVGVVVDRHPREGGVGRVSRLALNRRIGGNGVARTRAAGQPRRPPARRAHRLRADPRKRNLGRRWLDRCHAGQALDPLEQTRCDPGEDRRGEKLPVETATADPPYRCFDAAEILTRLGCLIGELRDRALIAGLAPPSGTLLRSRDRRWTGLPGSASRLGGRRPDERSDPRRGRRGKDGLLGEHDPDAHRGALRPGAIGRPPRRSTPLHADGSVRRPGRRSRCSSNPPQAPRRPERPRSRQRGLGCPPREIGLRSVRSFGSSACTATGTHGGDEIVEATTPWGHPLDQGRTRTRRCFEAAGR